MPVVTKTRFVRATTVSECVPLELVLVPKLRLGTSGIEALPRLPPLPRKTTCEAEPRLRMFPGRAWEQVELSSGLSSPIDARIDRAQFLRPREMKLGDVCDSSGEMGGEVGVVVAVL